MASPPRMTLPVLAVLGTFLDTGTGAELNGLEIAERCGLAAGTVYPIMQRLKEVGWIEDRWESVQDAVAEGRPARRYYTLTEGGRASALQAVTRASARRRAFGQIGKAGPASAFGTTGE